MDETATLRPRGIGASEESHTFSVGREEAFARLDRFLADKLREHGLSREKVKELIRGGKVTVNGLPAISPRQGLVIGNEVRVNVPARTTGLQPEEGVLSIVYRDAELAVLDKPAGITVHPAPGLDTGTLAHRLVAHFPELAAQEGFRPGIVHRLDKDTSGLMLVALTERCRLALAAMFARHAVYKEYLALVRGVPDQTRGVIDAPVGRHPAQKVKMAVTVHGKAAKSAWRVLHADPRGRFALMAVRIYSGRTHQVRVHMQHIGHPLWGDRLYGGSASIPASGEEVSPAGVSGGPDAGSAGMAPARQMLHAWKLAFIHPFPDAVARAGVFGAGAGRKTAPKGERLFFCCPPPADFAEAARFLSRETLRVVVTGSPGCGKSSLLEAWRVMGIPVFSADAEVARLYGKNGDGQRLLRARFGDRFVPDPAGPVDKAALGAAMREDFSLRREVEALVHPLVRHAVRLFWQEQEARGAALAAAEIPLYLETDFAKTRLSSGVDEKSVGGGSRRSGSHGAEAHGRGDALSDIHDSSLHAAHVLVGVYCPFALRRDRLMGKRGWSGETVALMESWQWPEEKKMAACDVVLDNTGTEPDLEKRAGELASKLLELRGERASQKFARLETLWAGDHEPGEEGGPL